MDVMRQPLVVVTLVVLAAAAVYSSIWPPAPRARWLGDGRRRGVIAGRVVGAPRHSEHGWTLTVVVERVDRRVFAVDRPRVRLFVPTEFSAADAPAGVPAALPGDRVEVFSRLESYPGRQFGGVRPRRQTMAARQIDGRALAVEPLSVVPAGPTLAGWLARVRGRFEQTIIDGLPAGQAGVAVAMTTGNRAYLQPATVDGFRHTGTSHLLAISGLHLGVLAALVWWAIGALVSRSTWMLRRWGRRRVCGVGVVGVLGCYVVAIGAPVSAVRAWVAIGFGVVSLVLLRPMCPFHALALAAIGLVGWQPAVVQDLGFQLSFCATLAIVVFLRCRPAILEPAVGLWDDAESPWRRRLRRVGLFVGVSLSATVATWPIVAHQFGRVAICGLWVNLVVTPVVSALVFPVLVAGALVSLVVAPVGLWLMGAAAAAMVAAAGVLAELGSVAGATCVTGAAPLWATLCLAAGASMWALSRWRPTWVVAAVVAVAAGLSPALMDRPAVDHHQLRVHFIPVGQGDATLLEFGDGTTMLIDAGGGRFGRDPGRFVVVPYLHRLGIARLDWVVATHADTDHMGGLVAVCDQMRPRRVVFDADEREARMVEFIRQAAAAGAQLYPLRAHLNRRVGQAIVDMTRPPVGRRRAREVAQNNRSIVVRVRYAGAAVLLTGDIEASAERRLVGDVELDSAIIKVAHHGSNSSSTPAFLDAVDPAIAVVSAGRFNRFGHPSADVLARYRTRGVAVWETARRGRVRLDISAGGQIELRLARPTQLDGRRDR